jgi:integrase
MRVGLVARGNFRGRFWESIEGTENEFRCFTGSTRKVRKNMLERFRVEHGQKRVAMLTAAHVKAILGDMSDRPGAANSLLKALRVLLRHAVDMGLFHDKPARNVRKLPVRSEGLHSWTENEVEMFEVTHRPGTRAHLSLALRLFTGQRRSDVARMGWQHIDGSLLNVTQDKTGAFLKVPMHQKLVATELERFSH